MALSSGISYAKLRLIEKIVREHWNCTPHEKQFNFNEIIFLLNAVLEMEGKPYLEGNRNTLQMGYNNFRLFVEHLLYRNLANFDSMILLTGTKGCLSTDTKIKTPQGSLSFDEMGIKDNDLLEVYAYDFENKREVKTTAQYFDTGSKDVYEIETEDGRKIKATKDHKFFVKREGKIIELPLRRIRENDILVCV